MIKDNVKNTIVWLDALATNRFNWVEKPGWLRSFWIGLTHSGDGPVTLILIIGVLLFAPLGWRGPALLFIIVDVLTGFFIGVLKVVVHRPRPEGPWGNFYRNTDPHSFPSGHSGRGGALGTLGLLVLPLPWAALALLWGMLVAASRVALGVHYASDALAGFFTGLIIALACRYLLFFLVM